VPANWTKCQITQGTNKTEATAADGTLKFDALPNDEAILVQPLR
jgi:hypothetical protein